MDGGTPNQETPNKELTCNFFSDDQNTRYTIVSAYLGRGTLLDLISDAIEDRREAEESGLHTVDWGRREKDALFYVAELAIALEILERNDWVHKGLRMEDIFVDELGHLVVGGF